MTKADHRPGVDPSWFEPASSSARFPGLRAKVRAERVRVFQVRVGQDRAGQVGPNFRMFVPPRIPRLDALRQHIQVLLIRHSPAS